MRTSRYFAAGVLLTALLAGGACFAQGSTKTGKVGFVVQLSGISAQFGVGVQHAVSVAQEELKQSGVIDLSVFYEDHQQQAQLGLIGFEKLVDRQDVPVVIANASPIVLAIAPAATERKKLLYNFAAVSPRIRTVGPWVVTGMIGPHRVVRPEC